MEFSGTPIGVIASVPDLDSNVSNRNRITTIQNTVELKLNNNFAFDEDAVVDIHGQLISYNIDGSPPPSSPIDVNFQIDFKAGALQKSKISDIYSFTNCRKVQFTIIGLTVTAENEQQVRKKLADFLEMSISFEVRLVSKIDYTTLVQNLNACYDQSTDELIINWKPHDNAVDYELEYTFVEDYADDIHRPIDARYLRFNFNDNSSRISTKETYCRVPLLFERGYILYRVRIIGRGGNKLDQPVYCNWTGVEEGVVYSFTDQFYFGAAHMNDGMNWQSSTTFSEDGKRLDNIKYFDGTFRMRQDVTGANFEKQNLPVQTILMTAPLNQNCYVPFTYKNREIIAGETIYDFQGRPSVNILPAPTNSLKLKYHPELNISNERVKPYNWKDFDRQNISCSETNPLSKSLYNNIMGSSAYYSKNNPNQYGFNAFIPDADGYPFTQIFYTPDNTGKVSVQSGLGLDFKMKSGHETRFFYGAANQYELDRMFGNEVGYEERYQKNAVRDPNGQVSVTYINPEGKTIATSLDGLKPVNLEALSSYPEPPDTIIASLINKNVINAVDKSLTVDHQFIVTSDVSQYNIKYTVDPEVFNAEKCDSTPVCLDCIYDIDLTLNHVESCKKEPLFYQSGPIGKLLNDSKLPDLSCDESTPDFSRDIVRTLNIGTYNLSKKITVNRQAIEEYINEIYKDTCKGKWQEILKQQLDSVDTLDCYSSCDDCDDPPLSTLDCDTSYCKPSLNRCDIMRELMLYDVSPGGQYAEYIREPNGDINASAYPLSILNWTGLADVLGLPSGTDYKTIVDNWLPEYSEKLIMFHPEYCKLGWCDQQEIKSTLTFDMKILAAESYSDALSKGYINTSGDISTQLLDADPWFDLDPTNPNKSILNNYLLNFGCGNTTPTKSIKDLAMEMAYCAFNTTWPDFEKKPQINSSSVPECELPDHYLDSHIFGSVNISPGNDEPSLADLEWTFLRGFYLSAKNRVIQSSMDAYAPLTDCDTRCIGDVWQWRGPWYIDGPPCSGTGFRYYDKKKRFGSELHTLMKEMNDEGYEMNLSGVDFNDPCQLANAIQNQSGNLNQQVSSIFCDSLTGVPCEPNVGMTDLFNSILFQFKDSALTLSGFQLPQSVRNTGIDTVTVNRIGLDYMRIKFQPMNYSMNIPYKSVDTSLFKPVSACVTNVLPVDTVSNFSLKVAYDNNSIESYQYRTTFRLNSMNTSVTSKTQNSIYLSAVSKYLNNIFIFHSVNNNFPNPAQLLNLLPDELRVKNNISAESVSLSTSGNLILKVFYPKNAFGDVTIRSFQQSKSNSVKFGFVQAFDTCRITLLENPDVGSWSDIGQIISSKPAFNSSNNKATTNFTATLVKASGNDLVEVKGSEPCWVMNDTLTAVTLCDSTETMPEAAYVNNCVDALIAKAYANASHLYNTWLDSMKNNLRERYFSKCMKAVETLTIEYPDRQHHYTLYYYDQAGNLEKTIPPEGVRLLSETKIREVGDSRKNNTYPVFAEHKKQSVYQFNTLNETVKQKSPDGGQSDFYYDGLGRIVASQNEVQKQKGAYAYSVYDKLGRITESGKVKTNLITPLITKNFDGWRRFIDDHRSARSEITFSQYDEAYPLISQKFGPKGQLNLRKRVASVLKFDNAANIGTKKYVHATHYSYDIMGNVFNLIQDYPNTLIGDKKIEYEYDLQSGKVNSVIYQRGAEDQFIHKYGYDALNRLISVKTSPNGLVWDTDAEYFYYRHGPLARMELGSDKVQGLDYMYTLQGWIKGVNGTTLDAESDMGRDGMIKPFIGTPQVQVINGMNINVYSTMQMFGNDFNGPGYGTLHNIFARDAFGYSLQYFDKDYTPINLSAGNLPLQDLNQRLGSEKDLFNGNISRMYTQLQNFDKVSNTGFNYSYDQLNRFISQTGWTLKDKVITPLSKDYKMEMKYDADGNITEMIRNGTGGLEMDKLKYNYYSNENNKLAYVSDQVSSGNYPDDIDGQTNTTNYKYDLIGNLTGDDAENISDISWNLQNKISTISKNNTLELDFRYDALGNRVMKNYTPGDFNKHDKTFYVRDAQGNVLSVYSEKLTPEGPKVWWKEAHIYGSSRLGMFTPDKRMGDPKPATETVNRGYKQYELTNHLGNVLATITDRKLPNNQTTTTTYSPDIFTSQDYYPFGMIMPERTFSTNKYKYGFNGQEKGEELIGVTGSNYEFKFREYDSRIGRFWAEDPIGKKYPWNSPYAFAENDIIRSVDIEGLEKWKLSSTDGKTTATAQGPYVQEYLEKEGAKYGLELDETPDEAPKNSTTITPIPYKGESTRGSLYNSTTNSLTGEITLTPNLNMGVVNGLVNGLNPLNWFSNVNNQGMDKEYQAGFDFGNLMGSTITSVAAPEALALMTTREGFFISKIPIKLKGNMDVSFRASEMSLETRAFNYSTKAPNAFLLSDYFARNMLQITPKFQTKLGPVINVTIPKGTIVNFGITGYQRGMLPGTWIQFYTENPIKF